MDDLDQKLLAALAADSSTSTSRLARRFKVARSTVQARIERMETNGTIAGYTVKLGNVALARRIKATVLVDVEARESAGRGPASCARCPRSSWCIPPPAATT